MQLLFDIMSQSLIYSELRMRKTAVPAARPKLDSNKDAGACI